MGDCVYICIDTYIYIHIIDRERDWTYRNLNGEYDWPVDLGTNPWCKYSGRSDKHEDAHETLTNRCCDSLKFLDIPWRAWNIVQRQNADICAKICMYIYNYIHIYVLLCMYIIICICKYVSIYVYKCVYTYIDKHIYIYIYIYMWLYVYMYMLYVCFYVYMCNRCICIYVYVYTYMLYI